ncbi:DIL domain myosin family protein [Spatholobus suberectus]|nr:DIL domain myosin family protein [Spatholobus suberectus]
MASTASPDVADGPVMSLIGKRLRALRKKLNRILAMEESVSQGKPLNKEQEEVLRSKPSVLALIDELEKLRPPLATALAEELEGAARNPGEAETLAENSGSREPRPNSNDVVVEDLLNLLYFGSLFDVKSDFASTMLTRTHERGCCLTYDYVTDDATDLLGEKDLDSISALRGLLVSRPADSSFSHKNALQRCVEHARLWLAKSEQPIGPNADVTYAGLREKLNKIMSSEYFTTTPEMKAPVEVAAAAAGGSYVSFHVPVHGSVVPVEVEQPVFQSQEKDEGTANFQGHGSEDDQSDPEGELQKEEVEAENAVEVVSGQHGQTNPQADVEFNQRDIEAKEQQSYPRRGYQNHRGGRGGGGRRGYSNGRGGRGGGRGGYQNGRNQYYDQPGNYYPRNYYNNRGRGGRGGGYAYNNHVSGGQVNHVTGDVGVQS